MLRYGAGIYEPEVISDTITQGTGSPYSRGTRPRKRVYPMLVFIRYRSAIPTHTTPSTDEQLAATMGHEIEHTTEENVQLKNRSRKERENKPEEKEDEILKQYQNKKPIGEDRFHKSAFDDMDFGFSSAGWLGNPMGR